MYYETELTDITWIYMKMFLHCLVAEGSDGTEFDQDFFNLTWYDLEQLEKYWSKL